MEQTIYYEDYQVGAVRETIGRTITETDIILHAGQTGDFFPHHMDEAFAKTSEFGRRFAHSSLTFSIAVGMSANLINPVAFSHGYDHLRFIRIRALSRTLMVKCLLKHLNYNTFFPEFQTLSQFVLNPGVSPQI